MKKKITAVILLAAAAVIIAFVSYKMPGKVKTIIPLSTESLNNSTYKNPSQVTEIGDPFVIKVSDGKYYCYPTSSPQGFKVWSSTDLVNWTDEGLIYKAGVESWGSTDFWAPEVVEHKGKFYMYYTARWNRNGSLRIGVATSFSPKGPFIDVVNRPMFDFGYAAIDANIFIDDDGQKYMYYSRDCSENIVDGRHESHIYGIRLNDDMVSVSGEPVLLTKPDQPWEIKSGGYLWNEGPTVLKHDGTYYLMYSANYYASRDYSIGYATASSPLGPFSKYENNPVFSAENEDVSGPGHHSIAASPDGKEMFAVYHTHTIPVIGGGNRQVCIDRMGFRKDGTIYMNGPTLTEQPMPSGFDGYWNIASEAKITASSVKDGTDASAINDGETAANSKNMQNLWEAQAKTGENWIQLDWNGKKIIKSLFIYGSGKETVKVRILLNRNQAVEDVVVPSEPGNAAVVNLDSAEVSQVRLEFPKAEETSPVPALSEVMVIGRDIGE